MRYATIINARVLAKSEGHDLDEDCVLYQRDGVSPRGVATTFMGSSLKSLGLVVEVLDKPPHQATIRIPPNDQIASASASLSIIDLTTSAIIARATTTLGHEEVAQ